MKKKKQLPDLHYFYEASVQGVDWDIDFAARVFKNKRKRPALDLREDFCGTAKLACEWVKRKPWHEAWGIDLDRPTLDWGIKYNAAELTAKQQQRLHLINGDVLKIKTPSVDMVMAMNFSFCV